MDSRGGTAAAKRPAVLRNIKTAALLASLALSFDAGAHSKNPLTDLERRDESLHGRVDERLRAGPYTYMRLVDAKGVSRWIVTVGRGALVGHEADVKTFGARDNFYSARLGRTFEHVELAWVTPR